MVSMEDEKVQTSGHSDVETSEDEDEKFDDVLFRVIPC